MRLTKSKSRFNLSWIIVVAILILLYSTYFLLYIPKQEMLVTQRGFRILEEYAENMHKKQEYFHSHFKNYSVLYAIRELKDYKSGNSWMNTRRGSSQTVKMGEVIDVVDNLVYPKLKVLNGDGKTENSEEDNKISTFENSLEPRLVFNIKNEYYAANYEKALSTLNIDSMNKATLLSISKISLPIDDLMENLKFDRLFTNIALLDSSEVIYNSDGSVVNSLSNFELLKKDTVSKTQGGVFTELEIKGANTHVMILPVKFLDQQFYLAGMISEIEFQKKTRTINGQLITILSGVLLLLLICMPVFKIIFINRKERLNVSDAHNTTISMILGTSLLTLIFIGTMKYYVVDQSEAKSRISNVSEKLVTNVEDNFKHIFSLADLIIEDALKDSTEIKSALISTDYYIKDENVYHDSIPFNEILFMDEKGKAIKAVTRTAFSNLIQLDLSNRNYFQKLEDDEQSWVFKPDGKKFKSFFIESIKSYNTGFKETAISFSLNEPMKTLTGVAPYMAITSHLPAMYDQVLPPDLAFVIIDKKGEVMYHSNQSKILHENFLVESGNHPRLTGGIRYRTIEQARISYNEQQWLAQIVPLEGVPLYHITLIDLHYLDARNTRVYLFTFYFILITFICIVLGMQIIQRLGTKKGFMEAKNWSFEWLIYNKRNKEIYRLLFVVQLLLLLIQVALSVFIQKPFGALVIQIIIISSTGFLSYFLLKEKLSKTVLVVFFILSGILIVLLIGLSITGLISALILLLMLTPIFLFSVFPSESSFKSRVQFKILQRIGARYIYFLYMFSWLISLSVIPVVIFYYSIKYQENILADRSEMIHISKANLKQQKNHEKLNSDFREAINGSDIDGYIVEYPTLNDSKLKDEPRGWNSKRDVFFGKIFTSTYAYVHNEHLNQLYREMQSPLTNDDYLMSLIQEGNKKGDWTFKKSFSYSEPGHRGTVNISKANSVWNVVRHILKLIILISIPVIIWLVFMWYIFTYLTDLVLGTIVGKWNYPNYPGWRSLLNSEHINRILLVTFHNKKYLNEIENYLLERIQAQDYFDAKDESDLLSAKEDKIIWISGLGEYLLQYKKAELYLPKLKKLMRTACEKVIVEMPYDLDFIQEYFYEIIMEEDCSSDEELRILNYLSDLKHLFSDLYRFTGSIDRKMIKETLNDLHPNLRAKKLTEKEILADAHLMKLQYSHVWNNLSRMEKLILFDLADDGLMNFKNRFLINRLKMKGLILLKPTPRVFDPSFQYFLKYSVNEDETLLLEQKLGKEGKWKNTRYLILLLLIPLIAFIFISQGTSVERVVGILTGVIALFSGALRLMDTRWFSGVNKHV